MAIAARGYGSPAKIPRIIGNLHGTAAAVREEFVSRPMPGFGAARDPTSALDARTQPRIRCLAMDVCFGALVLIRRDFRGGIEL